MNFYLVIHYHSTHHRSTHCRNPIYRHFTDSLSAVHLLPIMLVVHQTFASFTALKQAVEEWAISENFSTRMPIKDSKRVDFRCHQYRETNCPFRVYATQQKHGVEIRILESLHTCNTKKTGKYSHVNSQEWLLREVPKLIAVTKKVKPEQIIAAGKFKHRETVNYNAALQCRNTLAGNSGAAHALQFFYLPAYLDALHVHSPDCYMDLTTITLATPNNPQKRDFRCVFICPAESRHACTQSRQFVAVDGTWMKGFSQQSLLLACGVDANGQYILYTCAVVESEN